MLKSRLPVLVEFSGVHCAMCQEVNPVLAALARNLQDRLRVAVIEKGDGPDSFRQYKVPGVPTFILFNQGGELSRIPGVSSTDPEVFRKFLKEWAEQELQRAEQQGFPALKGGEW